LREAANEGHSVAMFELAQIMDNGYQTQSVFHYTHLLSQYDSTFINSIVLNITL